MNYIIISSELVNFSRFARKCMNYKGFRSFSCLLDPWSPGNTANTKVFVSFVMLFRRSFLENPDFVLQKTRNLKVFVVLIRKNTMNSKVFGRNALD